MQNVSTIDFMLRSWKMSDLDNLVKYANNPKVAGFLTDAFPQPYTMEDGRLFIEKVKSYIPAQVFAIVVEDSAVGSIGVYPQGDIMCKNAEIGYWLGEPYWGRGIVTKAVKEMVEYAFHQFDIVRIFARPFGNNMASQKVLEKCSFELEARIKKNIFKNGEYLDELIYAIRKK